MAEWKKLVVSGSAISQLDNDSGFGTGTVTSVATSGAVNGLTLSGGTITTTGTISLGGTLAINNSDWSGADLSLANGGTGASLSDPGADRILFWDDSAGAVTWLEAGSNLTITGTTIAATNNTYAAGTGTTLVGGKFSVDYAGTDNFILAAGAGSGTPEETWNIALSDGTDAVDYYPLSDLPFSNNAGTVTSVGGTGNVNGLTLTGTVTSTGNLTLGGTLAINNSDWSGADLSLANGGTGASLSDPGADRILFWDDSAGAVTWLTAGSNLTISGTTMTATNTNTTYSAGSGIGLSGTTFSVAGGDGLTQDVTGLSVDYAGADNVILAAGDATGTTIEGSWNIMVSNGSSAVDYYNISDLPFSNNNGDITEVVAGVGLSGGATSGKATLTLDGTELSSHTFGDGTGTITINGNLSVSGTTTTVDTDNLNVKDQFITLNDGGSAADAGIVVEGQGAAFGWDESASRWSFDFSGATEGQTSIASDAWVAAVLTGTTMGGANANYEKSGNILVDTSGDLWMYVE